MPVETARVVRWIIDHIKGERVLVVGDREGDLARELAGRGLIADNGASSAVVLDWTARCRLELDGVPGLEPGSVALAVVDWRDAASACALLATRWDLDELRLLGETAGVRGVVRESDRSPSDAEITELVAKALGDASLEVGRLESELRETEHELGTVRKKLRQRTVQLLESAEAQRVERERFEAQIRHGRLAAEKIKRTLSYRLGYELIHKTKSLGGLRKLPGALWRINQDAAARRGKSEGRAARGLLGRRRPTHDEAPRDPKPIAGRPKRDVSFVAPIALSNAAELRQLRVACIMDEFTRLCFEPECELVVLEAGRWREQIERARPHILFVESAWQGASGSWRAKIPHLAPELKELVEWCRDRGVPTAFWNKEDPVHFGTFLNTASMFDTVFTTDFDCIHRYQELLDHDRVYLLPFACQPELHNPIEVHQRIDGACFAGAYYARYPERQRDFLRILVQMLERGPFEIYDRSYGETDAKYQFPEPYQEFIVGGLPYSQIDKAYKGYRYGININSIKYSQTMFARRVFELLASNTLTVSNFSRGIRLMFGDLVIASDDPEILGQRIEELDADETHRARLRHAALRKVMSEHTYQHRLATIVQAVFGVPEPKLLPDITVVGRPTTEAEAASLRRAFERQIYPHKRLVILGDNPIGESEYVAWLSPGDFYGSHYLFDLALATRFFDGPAIGKVSSYRWQTDRLVLESAGAEYQTGQRVPLRAALVKRSALPDLAGADPDSKIDGALAIDRFHYCRDGAELAGDPRLETAVGELDRLDRGMALPELLDHAAQIEPAGDPGRAELRDLGPGELAAMFQPGYFGDLSVEHSDDGMKLESSLSDEDRSYIYESGERPLSDLGFERKARFHLQVAPGLSVKPVLIFFDERRKRLGHELRAASMNQEVDIPAEAVFVRLGLLIVGPGSTVVKRWSLGHLASEEPTRILGRADTLLLTNHYPSSERLYRNAFVHRRMLGYRERGERIDCFCLQEDASLGYYEHEGVEVTVGSADSLRRLLRTNGYKTILVHFLDQAMWRILAPYLDSTRVIVWLHGVEVQLWHRRRYDYETLESLEAAQADSAHKIALWREVFDSEHPNLRYVFVSEYFAGEVQTDHRVTLPPDRYDVIHNVIDTELFRYQPKSSDKRLRILSIRPFASRKYANDLTVAAILELSKKAWFSELRFHIVGDGPRFEQEVAPLANMSNVVLERRFLSQAEVADLHRENGVFLCPTRMDAQGVSRDEAMASGLVPVTTKIAAVPEFVDAECGFLAEPEDPAGLAAAIETLYRDPDCFERMSASAAARVRRQSSADRTISLELSLIRGGVL